MPIKASISLQRLIFFVTVFVILCSLSFWQYQRGVGKAYRLELLQRSNSAYHIILAGDAQKLEEFTPVQATGHFQPNDTFLLDNQTFEGKVGYSVFTVFTLENTEHMPTSFLVYRGFIPLLTPRNIQPEVNTSFQSPITITGKTRYFSKSFTLQPWNFEFEHAPFRIQSLDIEKLEQKIHLKLATWVLSLDEHDLAAFQKPPLQVYLTPEKHYGYAVQWALLAVTWLILCIVFQKKGD